MTGDTSGLWLETITNRGLAHSDAGKLSYEGAVNLWVLLIPMRFPRIATPPSGGSPIGVRLSLAHSTLICYDNPIPST